MKDYNNGDVINIADTIEQVTFNKETNESIITFNSNPDENFALRFKNDLTSKYTSGDKLKLRFKTLALDETKPEYAIPNYYKYILDHEGKAPDISNYLN